MKAFDPGLTQRYAGNLRRIINKDGSFNVHRRGGTYHLYLHLINMRWDKFFLVAALCFFLANVLFAEVYAMLGKGSLQGGDPGMHPWLNAFSSARRR